MTMGLSNATPGRRHFPGPQGLSPLLTQRAASRGRGTCWTSALGDLCHHPAHRGPESPNQVVPLSHPQDSKVPWQKASPGKACCWQKASVTRPPAPQPALWSLPAPAWVEQVQWPLLASPSVLGAPLSATVGPGGHQGTEQEQLCVHLSAEQVRLGVPMAL